MSSLVPRLSPRAYDLYYGFKGRSLYSRKGEPGECDKIVIVIVFFILEKLILHR